MKENTKALLSAITTSAIQLATTLCNPIAATIASISSPLIEHTISRALSRLVKKETDEIDKARLGFAYIAFCDYVNKAEQSGKMIRGKHFFGDGISHSKAEEILASLGRFTLQDKEDSKATAYGRIMGSVMFDSEVQTESIVHIIDSVVNLTMDDIEVLCCFSFGVIYHFGALDLAVKSSQRMDDHILYRCLTRLLALGLLVRIGPFSTGNQVENVRLSPMGNYLVSVLSPISQHTRLGSLFGQFGSR